MYTVAKHLPSCLQTIEAESVCQPDSLHQESDDQHKPTEAVQLGPADDDQDGWREVCRAADNSEGPEAASDGVDDAEPEDEAESVSPSEDESESGDCCEVPTAVESTEAVQRDSLTSIPTADPAPRPKKISMAAKVKAIYGLLASFVRRFTHH